ncbi:MAG TPA: HAMP domain-containing sensor histidine kinase [Acetobacteraceae bacterium]|jgi:signal transduction histidine kinase|nr:HAMP domain-containing sensor histidine kinase [Acetobacteraceae bacterium]
MPRDVFNTRPGREGMQRKTGRWYLIRSRRTPRGNDVTLRVDITLQKRLQEGLEAARRAAEAANQMKSQFLANATHELRTPLNAVINFAHLIADEIHGPLGHPRNRDYAGEISTSGCDLLALIDELLDLARAEAGHLSIVEGIAEPSALITDTQRMLAPKAANRGVTLVARAGRPVAGARRCDTAASGTGEPGSQCADVHRARRIGSYCRHEDSLAGQTISVHDTGIGIEAADLPRVMQPFEQAHEPGGERRPGVGLGLPLARHLVELHGGTRTLASEKGVGTTACVVRPAPRLIPKARP